MANWKACGGVLLILATLAARNPVEGQGRGSVGLGPKVIYAVNAGGPPHVDIFGVKYEGDKNTDGVASDFGMRLEIARVIHPDDQILYQTERYGTKSFGYDIPIKDDGSYVLVLKFCEVYFRSNNQKIFSVVLNNEHLVVPELDIYKEAGLATAHDEFIEFQVKNKGETLVVGGTQSTIRNGRVSLKFEKGHADNPKINAFYVIRGTINEVPKLPPMHMPEQELDELPFEEEDDEEISLPHQRGGDDLKIFSYGSKQRIRSGPTAMDPWDLESTNKKYLPVFGALAASTVFVIAIMSILKW